MTPKINQPPKVSKSFRLDRELVKQLQDIADKDKRSLNNLVEIILTNYLDNNKCI